MNKRVFLFSLIFMLSMCSFAFATNPNTGNVGNAAGNIVTDIGKGAGGVINSAGDAVKSIGNATQNVGQDIGTAVDDTFDGNNMNANNDGYYSTNGNTATYDGTTSSDYSVTRTGATMDTSNNAFTWIIVIVAAAAVVGLIWYYFSSNNETSRKRDRY